MGFGGHRRVIALSLDADPVGAHAHAGPLAVSLGSIGSDTASKCCIGPKQTVGVSKMTRVQIGLGAAHFGQEYGLGGERRRTSTSEVSRILVRGHELGVDLIDTAHSYGESEQVLGSLVPGGSGFKTVTKVPAIPSDADVPGYVRSSLDESLRRLSTNRLYGLLLHRADDCMAQDGAAARALLRIQDEGIVERVGVSIYSAAEIERALSVFEFDLIQVPLSVFDQRLLESDILQRLIDRGVEIHARSAFLQGAILMSPERLPDHLANLRAPLARWRADLGARGLTPLQAALGFLASRTELARVIVGVRTAKELEEVWEAVTNPVSDLPYVDYAVHDSDLIDPRRWPS